MNVLITGGAGFLGRRLLAALAEVAGDSVAARLRFEPDPFIEGIVGGWATRFDTRRGSAMGFKADSDFHDVVRAFIDDELGGRFVS